METVTSRSPMQTKLDIIDKGNALLCEVALELEKGSKGNSNLIASKLERAKDLFLQAAIVLKEYKEFDATNNPDTGRDCGNGTTVYVRVRPYSLYQYASHMAEMMDKVGFGNCSNTGACEAECPKQIKLVNIARMNREFYKAF